MEKDERNAPMTTTRTRFIFDSKLTPAALQPSQIRRPSGAASVAEVPAPWGEKPESHGQSDRAPVPPVPARPVPGPGCWLCQFSVSRGERHGGPCSTSSTSTRQSSLLSSCKSGMLVCPLPSAGSPSATRCCEAGYPPLETCCQERSRSRTRSSSVLKAMVPQTAAPRGSAGTGRTPQRVPALPHAVWASGAIFLEKAKNDCMKGNSKQDLEARKSVKGYPRVTGLGRV